MILLTVNCGSLIAQPTKTGDSERCRVQSAECRVANWKSALPSKLPGSDTLLSKIVTADGTASDSPRVASVAPDGLVIEYPPGGGASVMTKLDFAALQDSPQTEPKGANVFQNEQASLMLAFARQAQHDATTRAVVGSEVTRMPQPIVVNITEPVVQYDYYDMSGSRPAFIGAGMQGHTTAHFACRITSSYQSDQKGNEEAYLVRCESITFELGLTDTITIPNGERGTLRAHEEGHRQINEHFYGHAREAAQRAGKLMLDFRYWQTGQSRGTVDTLQMPSSWARGDTAETQESTAEQAAEIAVQQEYLRYIQLPAAGANKYYDELTDHGRNDVEPEVAVRRAIARFEQAVTTE